MDMSQAQGWILIITAVSTAAVSVITAWKVGKSATKVDEVHVLVNSQATADRAKIDLLQNLLVAKQLEIEATERVRGTLARATAADLHKNYQEPTDAAVKAPFERKAPILPKGKK